MTKANKAKRRRRYPGGGARWGRRPRLNWLPAASKSAGAGSASAQYAVDDAEGGDREDGEGDYFTSVQFFQRGQVLHGKPP